MCRTSWLLPTTIPGTAGYLRPTAIKNSLLVLGRTASLAHGDGAGAASLARPEFSTRRFGPRFAQFRWQHPWCDILAVLVWTRWNILKVLRPLQAPLLLAITDMALQLGLFHKYTARGSIKISRYQARRRIACQKSDMSATIPSNRHSLPAQFPSSSANCRSALP